MSDEPSTGVAVAPKAKPLVALITKRAAQVNPFLPQGMTLEGVGQIVQMMAVKQPELLSATPSSLLIAITRGLRSGLELGETWHLLPFKNTELSQKMGRPVYEVTGSADYKGLCELMIASGAVRYVDPQVVREGDTFSFALGLDKTLTHTPGAKRGKITHAYVILTLPFGVKDFLVMTAEEIEVIRQGKSKSWKKGELPAWYAMKTVIRQIAKTLPKGRKLAKLYQAIENDEQAELEDIPEAEFEEMPEHTDPETGEVLP